MRGVTPSIGIILQRDMVNADLLKNPDRPHSHPLSPEMELAIRARVVAASRVGNYGVSDLIETATVRERAIPGRSAGDLGIDDIQFSVPSDEPSMDWQETESVNLGNASRWKLVTVDDDSTNDPVVLLRMNMSSRNLFQELSISGAIGAEEALELYVGVQSTGSGSDSNIRRSNLTRMRHAVAPNRSELWEPRKPQIDNQSEDDPRARRLEILTAFMVLGNTAPALEQRPRGRDRQSEWVAADAMAAFGDYERMSSRGREKFGAEDTSERPPNLRVVWRHLTEKPDYAHPWGAVSGYRVWLIDRYDPWVGPATALKLAANVEVFPEAFYREFPESIRPKGRLGPAGELDFADWRRHASSAALDPNTITGDLKVGTVDEGTPEGDPTTQMAGFEAVPVAGYEIDATQGDPDQKRKGPIKICDLIGEVATLIANKLNAIAEVYYTEPLIERGAEVVNETPIPERIAQLAKDFNDESDPYGWSFLESLGLAAEVRFREADGDLVSAERVEQAANKLFKAINTGNGGLPSMEPLVMSAWWDFWVRMGGHPWLSFASLWLGSCPSPNRRFIGCWVSPTF